MNQFYYCTDGVTVHGPVTKITLEQLLASGAITRETPTIPSGETAWHVAANYIQIELDPASTPVAPHPPETPSPTTLNVDIVRKSVEVSEQTPKRNKINKDEEDNSTEPEALTRAEMLREIKTDLKSLWETQFESILSRIRNKPLDKEFEMTRKQSRDIYERMEKNCILYWRKSGVLEDWIEDLLWKDGDFIADVRHKLKGGTASEKCEDAEKWLQEADLASESACYCFIANGDYLYIGQATDLWSRIKDRVYYGDASHLRILIPKNKRWLNKLERLLILHHTPRENAKPGVLGNNAVDDTLEFIRREVKELVTDL